MDVDCLKSLLRKDGKINNRALVDTNPIVKTLKIEYEEEIVKYGITGVINILLYNKEVR